MENCKICNEDRFYKVNFNNIYLRTDSYNKNLHTYESRVCFNCGVVYQFPQIKEKTVAKHYETKSRITKFPIYFEKDNFIDFPFQFEQTGISFQRFFHFYKIIENNKKEISDLNFNNSTTILDYGAYQGAFLYACKKKWGVKTIAYDHNDNGLKFAKKFLDVDNVYKTKNINEDVFDEKINICTAIQSVEHLFDPLNFLNHVKKNVLKNHGFIYIEVPSALTSEYSNPSHLFMYTMDSLRYLFEACGYKIIHLSEEHIYNFKQVRPLKRHVQTMIHCLASTDGVITHNKNYNFGKKILKEIEISHFKNSNKIFLIKFKQLLRDGFILSYYSVFILIGHLSRKFSLKLFNLTNKILKKLPMLNRLSRK